MTYHKGIYIYIYIFSSASYTEAEESGEQEDVQAQTSRTYSSECCASQNKPYHPTIDFSLTRRIQAKQTWSFNAIWFKEHKWLTFRVPQNGVFCFYYRLAASRRLLTFSKSTSDTFVTKVSTTGKRQNSFENMTRLVLLNNLQYIAAQLSTKF